MQPDTEPDPDTDLPKPPAYRADRTMGIKMPVEMRAALFDEAARQTRTSDRHVSVGAVIREAITGHLARLDRARAARAPA